MPPGSPATRQRDDDFVFIIEEVIHADADAQSRPIGQAALYNIDWASGSAEYGRLMIGEPDAAGRGLAREATDALVALALEQLGLREIHLEVIPSNTRAITRLRGLWIRCHGPHGKGRTDEQTSRRLRTT